MLGYFQQYRVLSGRAWNRQTGHTISTVQWNQPTGDATFSIASQRETQIHLDKKLSAISMKAVV
jgi:hypothetical protein